MVSLVSSAHALVVMYAAISPHNINRIVFLQSLINPIDEYIKVE